jgi:hypothetical protein
LADHAERRSGERRDPERETVDHAGRPLESPFTQALGHRVALGPDQQEANALRSMEQCLVATGERRPHALALGRLAPIGGCVTVPWCVLNPTSTASLPYFPRVSWPTFNSPCCPISVARASPRWVFCSGDLRASAGPTEMRDQCIERLGHVAIAQIP